MKRLIMEYAAAPLARSTDPATSHMAASRTACFAVTHRDRICSALRAAEKTYKAGTRDHWGATAKELSEITGLTVVQIDRRLPELERDNLVTVSATHDAKDLIRDGFRVWEAV